MKETMSLVLATAILALGGLGLYMYKQSDDFKDDDFKDDDFKDDFSSYSDSDSELDSEFKHDYEEDFIDYEPKTKKIVKRGKTKRTKPTGGTRKNRY
jgi:hypothetical protein